MPLRSVPAQRARAHPSWIARACATRRLAGFPKRGQRDPRPAPANRCDRATDRKGRQVACASRSAASRAGRFAADSVPRVRRKARSTPLAQPRRSSASPRPWRTSTRFRSMRSPLPSAARCDAQRFRYLTRWSLVSGACLTAVSTVGMSRTRGPRARSARPPGRAWLRRRGRLGDARRQRTFSRDRWPVWPLRSTNASPAGRGSQRYRALDAPAQPSPPRHPASAAPLPRAHSQSWTARAHRFAAAPQVPRQAPS